MLQQKFSASLFQLALKQRAYLAIGGSGDVIQHFDSRHLRARHGVIRRHFQTDHAAAHHGVSVIENNELSRRHRPLGLPEPQAYLPAGQRLRHGLRFPLGIAGLDGDGHRGGQSGNGDPVPVPGNQL